MKIINSPELMAAFDRPSLPVECSKPTSPSGSSPRSPGQSRSVGGCKQCCVDSLTWSNASVVNWFI
jgi:hypothetical protein